MSFTSVTSIVKSNGRVDRSLGNGPLHLIASFAQSQWHITVTFEGSLQSDRIARADAKKRRRDLQNLYLCLDFDRLQLINDTVTEIVIKREHDNTPSAYENDVTSSGSVFLLKSTFILDSEYHPVLDQLRLCVREDSYRVYFPVLDCSSYTATKEFSELTRIRQLSAGVYEVRVGDGGGRYAYKEVEQSPLSINREIARF